MNVTADPCQDFYEYACGGFERSTQLSWNTPRKRTNPDIVLENYQDAISDRLSEDVKPTDGREVKAIKRVFQSCLGFQRNTHREILGVIEDLGGFQFGESKKSKDIDLTQLLTLTVLKFGVNALFDTHVLTSGKVGLTNQFSDSLLVDQMQSGFEPHRYRFLRPSDYIFRDEKKDAMMLAYKRFIGEVVAHILGIDERGETDQTFEEMIDDLYHINVYINRLAGLFNDSNDNLDLKYKIARNWTRWINEDCKFGDDYFENMSEMIQGIAMESVRGERRRFPTTEGSSIFFLRNKVLVEMPTSVYFLPLVYASSSADVWFGAVGTQIAQTISQLLDIDALLRFLSEDKIDHRVALTIAFRLQCLLDEYNKYTVLQEDNNMYRLKGDLTKNANFKDSLALRTGYKAFMKNKKGRINISGLKLSEEQTFFLVYAQSMCEKTNTRGAKQFYINTETSHHSPGRYRVLGTLSHFKKFADAFHCSANTEMNPANKCSLF
ncbi:endothelin-converting enzyme-like 1 [Mya arenaria]|uniref:endothelin-converting enzyme-like 1 n=1 Tax=Mya arenaria TaxID=6604 RepID=UPI0022DF530A|nr:endothelin-converting enzyme-like 1 [Mya arenaria]